MDSIWVQHKDVIQRLYVEERKTLAEVKKIMENDFGFPDSIPKSAYEVALRDELGLIKKLKKEHWPFLYQRFLQRQEEPFDLYVHGTLLYRWPKVWKELRRSRKIEIDPGISLPPGLELRTPSSMQSSPSSAANPIQFLPRPIGPSSTMVSMTRRRAATFKNKGRALEPTAVSTSVNMALARTSIASTSPSFRSQVQNKLHKGPLSVEVSLQLETIPWNETRLAFLAALIGPEKVYCRQIINNISYAVIPKDKFLSHISGQRPARVSDSILPSIWDLEGVKASFTALTPSLNGYHILNTILYLLSNNLINLFDYRQKSLFNTILDFLLHYIPKAVLHEFFNNQLLSMRAVWDSLLRESYFLLRTDVFELIAGLALENHVDWISGVEDMMLEFAALSGHARVIRRLLELETQSNTSISPFSNLSFAEAIIHSTKAGFQECVSILLAGICDRNNRQNHQFFKSITFQFILEEILFEQLEGGALTHRFHLTIESSIKAGADFSSPLYLRQNQGWGICLLHSMLETARHQLPTWTDMMYYYKQAFFCYLTFHGVNFEHRNALTRAGVCIAAAGGRCGIANYIDSRSPRDTIRTKEFLELIYLEQFFLCFDGSEDVKVNASITRSLVEYGVEISQEFQEKHGGANTLLGRLMRSLDGSSWTNDELFLLEYLIRQVRILKMETVEDAVQAEGTRLLELLALHGHDVSQCGASALVLSARKGNQKAIRWLLEEGVSINSEVPDKNQTFTVLGATLQPYYYRTIPCMSETPNLRVWTPGISLANMNVSTVRYLIQAGADLKLRPIDRSPFFLLESLAKSGAAELIYNAFEYFSSLHAEMAKLSTREWVSILTSLMGHESHKSSDHAACIHCIRCQLFMELFQRHCESECGKLLAVVIHAGARENIIQHLIARIGDIDEVATITTEFGGSIKLTPLQAAAARCDNLLCSQLLGLGADVNAPSQARRHHGGYTALQAICQWDPVDKEENERKSELIEFLLIKGAKVNDEADTAPDALDALQHCVAHGDLKHTALLLEHGADPNRPYMSKNRRRTLYSTLGVAVLYNRLDIVHFLLGIGALSVSPGQSGYDGAIDFAREKSHITIANLIQRHVDKQRLLFRQQPELRVEHEASVKRHGIRMEQFVTRCRNMNIRMRARVLRKKNRNRRYWYWT